MNDETLEKLKRLAAILTLTSGMSQIIAAILSIGMLTVVVTLILFGGFLIFIGLRTLQLIKKNELTKDKEIVIIGTVVPFLTAFANLFLLLFEVSERPFIGIFLIFHIILSIFIFPINFYAKMKFDEMNRFDAITYWGIILTRGLGLNYLFQPLAWVLPDVFNPTMIIYLLTFGFINSVIGRRIYKEKENKRIQVIAIICLAACGLIGLIFVIIWTTPNQILFVTFAGIDVVIRTYYVKKKFKQ